MGEILAVRNLSKTFNDKNSKKLALKDVSFSLNKGEVLGIVGESGSGKSTLLRVLSKQVPFDEGEVTILGKDIKAYGRELYRSMQMVFQNPRGSFNPSFSIGRTMEEIQRGLGIQKGVPVSHLLKNVGLKEEYQYRCPKDLSGGECQRAAIAKSFSVLPEVLLCDEITSALDVSAQAKIIDLLMHLVEDHGISVLFVSHNLALVSTFCHRLLIFNQGNVVEEGMTREVLEKPKDDYTKALLRAQAIYR